MRSKESSALVLERAGAWRWPVIVAIVLLPIAAALPLLKEAFATAGPALNAINGAFGTALENSLETALVAALVALVIGLPTGLMLTLYEFAGRRVVMVVVSLPLLLPPFLLALGWAMLDGARLAGQLAPAFVFALWSLPLVVFAAYAAGTGLSASVIEATRLAGGERRVIQLAARHVFIPALAAAGLGAALTLADPGPGQVFRMSTVASEILTSFAALNDFGLAARQSVKVAAVIMLVAAPFAWFVAPRMAQALMARQTRRVRRQRLQGTANIAVMTTALSLIAVVFVPIAGLALPLQTGGIAWFSRALSEAARTAGDTLIYAAGAGFIAVFLGTAVAVAVGRGEARSRFVIAACLSLLCLPPVLADLGVVRMAAVAPAWTDDILRSRFTLCLMLGLRLVPVATVFMLRSWASSAPSWTHAAAVHGVSLQRFLGRVMLPHLAAAASAAFLVCALLSIADTGTALLLYPPGAPSFPLAIFTVMANAPEAFVASLSLVYVGITAVLLFAAWGLVERRRT